MAKKPAPKKKKDQKKRGRPSAFTKLNLDQVEQLARLGWTNAQMAAFFGIPKKTWDDWILKKPAFKAAVADWKREADARVERSLYERAMGYSHPEDRIFCQEGKIIIQPTVKHYPPDTTACIFWLKNRQPEQWRDRADGAAQGTGVYEELLEKVNLLLEKREPLRQTGGDPGTVSTRLQVHRPVRH